MSSLNQLAEMWWRWMGEMLWQSSLLILILSGIDFLLKKWIWPQVRYTLWLLVLLKLIIPPTFALDTSIISRVQPRITEQMNQYINTDFFQTGSNEEMSHSYKIQHESQDISSSQELNSPIGHSKNRMFSFMSIFFLIWIGGIFILFAILFGKMMRLRRWHDQQDEHSIPEWFHQLLFETSQKLGLNHLPAIVFHNKAKTPAVYGLFRPVMLLPANYFDNLTHEQAQHVLLHELAHLKRGDLWLHGLCLFLQIFYWFNPFLIWVRRQMKHVREICCDLTVAQILKEKTKAYRITLLNTARELLTERVEPGLGLLGVFEEPFRLVSRLRWLEKETWHFHVLKIVLSVVTFVFIAFLLLPMAGAKSPKSPVQPAAIVDEINFDSEYSGSDVEKCYFIKEIAWSERYYLWKKTDSHFEEPGQFWITQDKAWLTQNNRTYFLDKRSNTFIFLNHDSHTYVVLDLPLKVSNIYSDELNWIFRNRSRIAQVKDSGNTKQINGRLCKKYVVKHTIIDNGKKRPAGESIVWATLDVPFDLSLHDAVLVNMRKMHNLDDESLENLSVIKGMQAKIDIISKRFPIEKRFCSEVLDVLYQQPPDSVFVLPEHYREKDKIEPQDLGM